MMHEPFSSAAHFRMQSLICCPAKRLQCSDAGMVAEALKEKVDDAMWAYQQQQQHHHHHDNWGLP
jgi:hypothetical protein